MTDRSQRLITGIIVFLLVHFASFIYAVPQNSLHTDTLYVGVYDNPPKIFINTQGKPDGIFIDVLNVIARNENLTISYVQGSWPVLYTMLKNNEIDVLPDMAYSDSRDSLFQFSMPVLGSWLEVFSTENTPISKIADLNHKRIGVLKTSSQEDFLKSELKIKHSLDYQLYTFDSYSTSVAALKDDSIDVLVANRFFYFSELCNDDVLPTGIILQLSELHFAFSQTTPAQTIQLFDKNISLLKNDLQSEYYASLFKWFRKGNPGIPAYIKILIAASIAGFLIFLLFTFVLNRRVNARTKALKQRNEELILARQKAEESDKLKTIFLQNMSHEIRTPMNGILGFAELLQEPDLSIQQQQNYLESIKISGNRMLNIINDIVTISKIETGIAELVITETDIKDELKKLFVLFNPDAKAKNLQLSLKIPPQPDHLKIKTDQDKLRVILKNLLRNAIKFTDQGSIEFGYLIKGSLVEFYVRDTGEGIDPGRQEAIFDRFMQADVDDKKAKQGAGLGLAIAKAYVEMLGGRIRVESTPGKGSAFYFTIPSGRSPETGNI